MVTPYRLLRRRPSIYLLPLCGVRSPFLGCCFFVSLPILSLGLECGPPEEKKGGEISYLFVPSTLSTDPWSGGPLRGTCQRAPTLPPLPAARQRQAHHDRVIDWSNRPSSLPYHWTPVQATMATCRPSRQPHQQTRHRPREIIAGSSGRASPEKGRSWDEALPGPGEWYDKESYTQ